MKTIIALSFLAFLLFTSCSQESNTDNTANEAKAKADEERKYESEKLERVQTLNIISKQYGASIAFDTVKYKMTYQYQDLLRNNNRVIIEKCYITDIEKIDTSYVISIIKTKPKKMYIYFTCTQSQLRNVYPNTTNIGSDIARIDNKYLILRINSIQKLKLKIAPFDCDGENGYKNVVELSASQAFICRGEYIGTVSKPQNK
jgi:hypothetical protein